MTAVHIDICTAFYQFRKAQLVFVEQLADKLAVEIAYIQYAYLAFKAADIFDDVECFCLTDSKIKFKCIVQLYSIDECVYRKGLVLC